MPSSSRYSARCAPLQSTALTSPRSSAAQLATGFQAIATSPFQHAPLDLIFFDRFEQGLEVAFAESVVALALDELEEDWTNRRLAEPLQQDLRVAAFDDAFAVDEDAIAPQPREIFPVSGQALIHPSV